VSEFLCGDGIDVKFPSYKDGVIPLRRNHTVAGNPIRLTSGGEICLRMDTEWQEKMSPAHKQIVTTLTAPMLGRYGYLNEDAPTAEPSLHEEEIVWEADAQATPD
jgi:hypothetical protein